MRTRLFRISLLLLLAIVAVGGHRSYWRNYSQDIDLVPLSLDQSDPKRKSVGELEFLKAWELRSDNSDFGGISAVIAKEGGQFLALSDAGTLIGFELGKDNRWQKSFIAALPGAQGENVDYRDRDSEGMAYDPATGQLWVSYEARHAIRRFPPSLSRIDGINRLGFTQGWKKNGGIETIARLSDGRFLIIAETHLRSDGSNSGFLFSGDPVEPGSKIMPFGYRAPQGYRPTDAAIMPDGRIMVLNRRIAFPNGFTAKIGIIDPAEIDRDRAVQPRIIATLAPPLLVDNMEGLAITSENDRTIVWIISDDNFSGLQRTILMKFALNLDKKKPEAVNAPGFETLSR